MPTGYTAAIADGIPFEQFVWNCARAFGALILMRDDRSDAPIPERFEPSDSYRKWTDEARTKLAALEAMSLEDVQAAAAAAHKEAMDAWRKAQAENIELRNKYSAMLAKAIEWTPPTPEHEPLREFMIKQIRDSINFDCHEYPAPAPQEATAWHNKQVEQQRRMVARYVAEQADEVARTESRNQWLRALRNSVPMPGAK